MNRLLLVTVLLFAGGCNAPAAPDAPTSPNASLYAFENVHVLPMDEERVLEGHTVLVSGDRITAVGPAGSVEVPAGATRIDGQGRYLMPGLAEMHGHIPHPDESQAYIESVLFMYVANGLTTVRGMQGHPGQLDLKARVNAGELAGPNLYLAGPGFSGGSVDSPEQAADMVRQQHAEGWDLLKVLPGLTREEYDAMASTANELGIPFAGHVPADVGLVHAIEMGQQTFDHIDGYIAYLGGERERVTDQALADAARMTVDAGVWIVPTMVVWESALGTVDVDAASQLPELRYMPPNIVEGWIQSRRNAQARDGFDPAAAAVRVENRMRLLNALNDAGARILMGTDAPQWFSVPGFSIHVELERMVEAGMTPFEVYHTGTVRIGEYFADEDTFGMVAPGHRADLLLLEANPLDDVANVARRAGVMVQGRWLPEADIQARLQEIAAMHE